MNKFDKIRKYYKAHEIGIKTAKDGIWGTGNPYGINWEFTPIESEMWISLRTHDLVMYPQFPIGKYFADFANPQKRVVVECDGARWHSKEKDEPRNQYMAEKGWWLYRVPGRDCFGAGLDWQAINDSDDEGAEMIERWALSGDALACAIAARHFNRQVPEVLRDALSQTIAHFATGNFI